MTLDLLHKLCVFACLRLQAFDNMIDCVRHVSLTITGITTTSLAALWM